MGNKHRLVVVVAMVMLGLTAASACGPSSAQVARAREARYQGTRDEVFLAAMQAVEPSYKVFRSDPETATFITEGRWYEADGTYADNANADRDTTGGAVNLTQDGATFVGFVVEVVGAAPPFQVVVRYSAHQVRSGYSAPYKFLPDDPQLPGWIRGKVDNLQLEVHQRMKGKFISPPGVVAGS